MGVQTYGRAVVKAYRREACEHATYGRASYGLGACGRPAYGRAVVKAYRREACGRATYERASYGACTLIAEISNCRSYHPCNLPVESVTPESSRIIPGFDARIPNTAK